jgi:hypothetical protein
MYYMCKSNFICNNTLSIKCNVIVMLDVYRL